MTDQETPLQRAHRLIEEDQERVFALIRADKKYRTRERDREAAQLEVAEGKFVNLGDSVVEPTPEWMGKGDTRSFTPKQPDHTTKVAKSVRRVVTPMVVRMLYDGRLTEDQAHACMWYRAQYDAAGLSGRVKTSHISLTGNTGGSGGMGQAPMALHHREAEARGAYRAARAAITEFYVPFFEAVVIHDISVSAAARYAKCRNDRAPKRFRDVSQELLQHCERVKASLSVIDDQPE